jgi:hypothetical protein
MFDQTTVQELTDALAIVESRAAAAPDDGRNRQAVRLWLEANQLWTDEYTSWKALTALGLESAADAAWKRRTVAADLASLLLKVAL